MALEENFLRLTVTVCFQKNECFQNVNFLTFFLKSISYNNVVVRQCFYIQRFTEFGKKISKKSTLTENPCFISSVSS